MLDVEDSIEGFELPKGARLDDYNLTCESHEYDSDFEPNEEEDEEDEDIVVVKSENRCSGSARKSLKCPKETPEDSFMTDDSLTLEIAQAAGESKSFIILV